MRYDTTQIKNHKKRNKAQKKLVKDMLYHLDLMFGESNAGLFLAIVCSSLDKMMNNETPSDRLELRTMEITMNDCYSVKYDFEKEEQT